MAFSIHVLYNICIIVGNIICNIVCNVIRGSVCNMICDIVLHEQQFDKLVKIRQICQILTDLSNFDKFVKLFCQNVTDLSDLSCFINVPKFVRFVKVCQILFLCIYIIFYLYK